MVNEIKVKKNKIIREVDRILLIELQDNFFWDLNFMYSLQEALSIIKLVLFCACDKNWYDMKNVNSAWYSGHLLVLQGTET